MRRIRYTHKRNKGCWGKAFIDDWRIEIDPELEPKTLLDISIHEALHLLFPYTAEQDIDEAGKTIADLLWRLGFRHED